VAVIDLEVLDVEVVDVSRDELLAALDEACRDELGITGEEFIDLVREGQEIDDPAAARLAILARALIERD
jgi:hypothetical protein